jgi:hypothetical protein
MKSEKIEARINGIGIFLSWVGLLLGFGSMCFAIFRPLPNIPHAGLREYLLFVFGIIGCLTLITYRIVVTPEGFTTATVLSFFGLTLYRWVHHPPWLWRDCLVYKYIGFPFDGIGVRLKVRSKANNIMVNRFYIGNHQNICKAIWQYAKGKATIEREALDYFGTMS